MEDVSQLSHIVSLISHYFLQMVNFYYYLSWLLAPIYIYVTFIGNIILVIIIQKEVGTVIIRVTSYLPVPEAN